MFASLVLWLHGSEHHHPCLTLFVAVGHVAVTDRGYSLPPPSRIGRLLLRCVCPSWRTHCTHSDAAQIPKRPTPRRVGCNVPRRPPDPSNPTHPSPAHSFVFPTGARALLPLASPVATSARYVPPPLERYVLEGLSPPSSLLFSTVRCSLAV
jgi:hypothetical protein